MPFSRLTSKSLSHSPTYMSHAHYWCEIKSNYCICRLKSNIVSSKATMDYGEKTSSSLSISKNDYEVFLSFRGPDTRQGFTNCLYHALIDIGIRVFIDDDELPLGVKIDEILHALENSKICIVVFSPTYAESAWCLREVERMVCMKKDIVPIFYHVTPNDVKLKTELYANALIVHETNYGKEQVRQWMEALKEIPTIKGRELKNSGFVEFSKQISKEILTNLKVKRKYKLDNFVEVTDEVEAALKLLDIGAVGCRFLGIHGMGGIGKTTLAKIIFNRISDSFDCSCFLENIRENLTQCQGDIHKLQEQLLRSLDPSLRDASHIFNGVEKIKNNFSRKKVIIVLDDIDDKNHLRGLVGSFGSGSRIIFTTRNVELHEQQRSLFDADFYGLEKKEMNSKQALELFSRHAFGGGSPPKEFEDLSIQVISTMGGLPLGLEVVGSLLYRRKSKVWRETIKKLKEAPHQDVQRKLKISYDALDAEQQEIFLDIACFFIDVEKTNVVYMWEACKFYPNNGIQVLISMSLIKLSDDKCFWMHDQLRDLGRAIVRVNSEDARAGTRLWMHKDALDLLKGNGGKEKVEALHLDGPSDYLDSRNFVGLEKLRFLRMTKCANFGGDFGRLFPKLRWLSLLNASSCNMSNLCLTELVVLELSSCRFDETWSGWGKVLISGQLKVLTLSHCHELISTPDLSKIVNLERLVLEKCHKLTSIHSSIGKLQCLRRLSIIGCHSLRELPEELTSLESLKQILLHYSYMGSLANIHLSESIRYLVSLTRLELWRIANLPNNIGELVKLKHLSLRDSVNLSVLPDSIGDLKSLVSLDLWGVWITELPTTIGRLAKLESLCLCRCKKLQRLPESIGNLHSLIDLDMYGSSIAELPHSFGNLASLRNLNLMDSEVRSLPNSFRGLQNLEKLDIGDTRGYWIRELHELPTGLTWLNVAFVQKIQNLSTLINLSELEIHNPVWLSSLLTRSMVLEGIEKLSKLKRLSVECWDVKSLYMEWGNLQQLKSLKLCCPSLEFQQSELPSSLESLDLRVKKWGQLPINFSSLKNLLKLKLSNFLIEELDSIHGLECLEVLEMRSCILKFNNFPVLKRMRNLHLNRCHSHSAHDFNKLVPVIGLELQIQLSNLKNLSKLELTNFSIPEDGFEVLSRGLEYLVDFNMNDCIITEFTNISVMRNLRSLYLKRCSFPFKTCLDIPRMNRLVDLNISFCRDLVDIRGIGKLKSLAKLCISNCDSLRRIEDLSELNGLTQIMIYFCLGFEGIDGGIDKLLSGRTLFELDIQYCKCESVRYQSSPDYTVSPNNLG